MRKFFTLLFFLLVCIASYSQDTEFTRSFRIAIGASLGIGLPIRFEKTNEDLNYYGKATNSFNLNFSKFFSNNNAIQAGIVYSKSSVRITMKPQNGMVLISPHTESFELISVPISYNFYFNKLYYIGIGTILDFEIPNNYELIVTDKQSGLGLTLEAGKEFLIKRVTINISPSIQLHSFAPFQTANQQQRLFVANVNIGINYNLR